MEGEGEGEGKGAGAPIPTGLGFQAPAGRVGMAWHDSIVDPFIYSFMHSFINLCIRSFFQIISGTRTGTPEGCLWFRKDALRKPERTFEAHRHVSGTSRFLP